MHILRRRPALRISLIYSIISGLYILLSDQIVIALFDDTALLTTAQSLKGLGFVLLSALLIYALLRQELHRQQCLQDSLRESETRFRATFDQAAVGMAHITLDGRILRSNRKLAKILGYPPEELADLPFLDLLTPAQTDSLPAHEVPLSLDETQPRTQEVRRFVRKNGVVIWVSLTASIVVEPESAARYIVAVVEDITPRKATEDALRRSEDKFAKVFHNSPDAIAIYRLRDGVTVEVNAGFTALTGYTAEEVVGRNLDNMPLWANPATRELCIKTLLREGQIRNFEMQFTHRDGSAFYGLTSGSVVEIDGEDCIVTVTHDITARIAAERALNHYAQRLEVLHEIDRGILARHAPEELARFALEYIWHIIPCTHISVLTFSEDYTEGVVLALRFSEITEVKQGDTIALRPARIKALGKSKTAFIYDDLQTETDLSLIGEQLRSEGVRALAAFPLKIGEAVIGALNISKATPGPFDGEHIEIVREVADLLALSLHQANLDAQIKAHTEELEQRVADRTQELTAANERLTELDAMKSKFVSDVSHELRAPITNLGTYLHLLQHGKQDPAAQARYLDSLQQQVGRLKKLVESILDLSRLEVGKTRVHFDAVAMSDLINQVVDAHRPRAEAAGLALHCTCPDNLPPVWGVHSQLAQVITNLLTNAINYTDAGHIRISAELTTNDRQFCLRVEDTGMGIDPEDLPHLFERFYRGSRTHDLDIPGTGLGLGIVKEIVDLHRGEITVESTPGQGSTFTVHLPLAEDESG